MGRRSRGSPPAAVETGVGRAEVVPDAVGTGRTLIIAGQVHGHVDPADPARLALDYQARALTLALALLPARPASVVHLGGGAVAIPRALAAHRDDLDQLVVERSGAVIGLAERHLGLRQRQGLRVRKGDGRAALARLADASVDLVLADAFVGERTPRHLTTVGFAAEVRRVLTADGAYLANLVDEPPWGQLAAHLAAVAEAFGPAPADLAVAGSRGVARLRDPGNAFVLASPGPLPRSAIRTAGATARHPVALVPDGSARGLVRGARPHHDP